jgi:CBS domain containing-hemolysin-like protein
VSKIFHPVIVALNWLANGIVRLFGVEPKDEAASTFTLEEVATIVTQSRAEGVLDDTAGTITAVVEFTDKKAKDAAVPLAQIVSLPQTTTPAKIERAVAKRGFSRYVIVDDEGAPIGYVHLKDILRVADSPDAGRDRPIPAGRIHRMVPLDADTDLEDALAAMRAAGRHLSLVTDADGAPVGVLFLEDVIEELIGEVHDATRRGHGRRP